MRAAGFPTIRTFNSDLEFVFRAYVFLRLRKVDEFQYIRRVRAVSLTTGSKPALSRRRVRGTP